MDPLSVLMLFAITVAILTTIVGSITDFQKREVADWINFGALFAGVGMYGVYSAFTGQWYFLLFSLVGAGVMFGLALLMYYTGQWGGGDAKMLAALGALLPVYVPLIGTPVFGDSFFGIPVVFGQTSLFLVHLFINILLCGAVYGLLWSIGSAVLHLRAFFAMYRTYVAQHKVWRLTMYGLFILALLSFFIFPAPFDLIVLLIFVVSAFMIFIKFFIACVEQVTMKRQMTPEQLTEGEWVLDNVHVGGTLVSKAKCAMTSKDIARLTFDSVPQVTVRKWLFGRKHNIALYDFDEHYTLLSTVKIGKKSIGPGHMSKDDIYALMIAKYTLRSQTVLVHGKRVHFSDLHEGVVPDEDVYNDRLTIITPPNLGIDRYQIQLIQQKYRKPVLVKVGVPFIPAFFLGLLVTLYYGSPLLLAFV